MGLLPQSDPAPGVAPQPCGPDGRCGALAAALERAQAENRRLETAFRAASEFLARMSHEL
ncbi:MAG: hypothetical protein IRY94_01425, partial [Rhodospirillaceae bacterium]|nr:hypothetical protein [Rhodospirillaceae bacterium]